MLNPLHDLTDEQRKLLQATVDALNQLRSKEEIAAARA